MLLPLSSVHVGKFSVSAIEIILIMNMEPILGKYIANLWIVSGWLVTILEVTVFAVFAVN